MSGGGWEDGVPKNALRLRGVFYIPPHQRHNSSPAPANGWSQAPFPARFPGQRPARHQRGRCRPSPRQPNLFAVAADEFNDLRISETVDVASGGFNGAVNGIDFDAYDDIPVETSGTDVPPQARTFDEIDLGEALCRNIRRCRYVKPTPVQRYAIPISLAGRDLMACAQTGSGKTAAFCFPIISGIMKSFSAATQSGRLCGNLLACPRALILCPTRELSCQIHDEAKKFSYQTGVKVCVVYGGAPAGRQLRELEKGVDILVATPGRLLDLIERARVSLQNVYYLALDEADRMLDMGFEHQIRKIVEQMDMPPRGARQTMLFSATFPNEIQRLASDFLSNYIFLAVGRVGSSTELIKQRIEYVSDKEKRNHLIDLLHAQKVNYSVGKKPLTLIFVETKRGVDSLQNWLRMNGFPTTSIHGDRIQYEREQALKSFKCGATPIMVATDVAARGLDIPHVAHVINFDLPKDIIDYVHRIGRTGRAGKCGLATAFFSDSNQPLAKALAELMQESSQEIPGWLSQFAEKCCFEERNRRCGGSKYAGHEFRHDGIAKRGLDNSNTYSDVLHSNCVSDGGDTKSGCSRDGSDGCTGGVSSVVGFDDTAYRTMAYGIGYDQIVATGWD